MPTRKAGAVWEGKLKGGNGKYHGESGLKGSYSFGSRFENGGDSNPEELLAAAEASCFSMALSGALEKNGTPSELVTTDAACSIERDGERFTITSMRLHVRARVPGIDEATFKRIAEATKEGCPVSRAIKGNMTVEVEAELES